MTTLPFRVVGRIAFDGSGCWLWSGGKTKAGYATCRVGDGVRTVHRLMFEFAYGAIPLGHQIHHTCEVRNCVHPGHLIAVTQAEHNDQHGYKHSRLGVLARMRNHPEWKWKEFAA
jgi:hypothetical protein